MAEKGNQKEGIFSPKRCNYVAMSHLPFFIYAAKVLLFSEICKRNMKKSPRRAIFQRYAQYRKPNSQRGFVCFLYQSKIIKNGSKIILSTDLTNYFIGLPLFVRSKSKLFYLWLQTTDGNDIYAIVSAIGVLSAG